MTEHDAELRDEDPSASVADDGLGYATGSVVSAARQQYQAATLR